MPKASIMYQFQLSSKLEQIWTVDIQLLSAIQTQTAEKSFGIFINQIALINGLIFWRKNYMHDESNSRKFEFKQAQQRGIGLLGNKLISHWVFNESKNH